MGRPQHIVCWPKLDYLVILNNSLTLSPALSKIPIYSRSLFQEYFYILFFLYPEGDFFFFFSSSFFEPPWIERLPPIFIPFCPWTFPILRLEDCRGSPTVIELGKYWHEPLRHCRHTSQHLNIPAVMFVTEKRLQIRRLSLPDFAQRL